MKELSNWTELFWNSIKSFSDKFTEALPFLVGALLIFFFGWLIAKFVGFLVSKILKTAKFDILAEKVNASEYLAKANVKSTPSKLIGKFVYFFIMLLVLISASETLGWTAVSNEISSLLAYVPKLFIAIIIFIIGTYFATFVRDIISGATASLGISTGKIIATFVFYLIIIMTLLTSLDQAGIDISIITSNLLIILGAMLAAAAIGYGIASKDVLSNILAGYFGRNMYQPGMHIEINGAKGEIIETSNIGITIKTADGNSVVVPTREILTHQVVIFAKPKA